MVEYLKKSIIGETLGNAGCHSEGHKDSEHVIGIQSAQGTPISGPPARGKHI